MTKTDKTMAEMEIDQNLSYEFKRLQESGKALQPVHGPGYRAPPFPPPPHPALQKDRRQPRMPSLWASGRYTGLQNLGNSCYLASVVQVLFSLPPFIDVAPFRGAPPRAVNPVPVLLSVGMMRTRDKLASYGVLAAALLLLKDRSWRAVLVGDGPARREVEALMAPLGDRVQFSGAVAHRDLPALYAASDLYLWPAINEAYGMAFLEAQATGLPVVAGRTGGVPAVVADGVTGLLTPIGDPVAFASAVARLLDAPESRARLGAAAAARVAARHDETAAARALAAALRRLR